MICPHCNYDKIEPGAVHCSQCGGHLGGEAMARGMASPTCPNCGNLLPDTSQEICPVCGIDIKDAGIAPAGTPVFATGLMGRRASFIGGVLGLIATVVVIFLLSQVAVEGSFTQKMFLPGGILNIVPWTITFLFLWSVCVLILRGLRMGGLRRQVQAKYTNKVQTQLNKGDISSAMKTMEGHTKGNILLNRIYQALYTWRVTGKLERVEDELERQTDLDVDAAVGGYSEIRTFIWAMPVIGFIGTVIGISIAVGDFSSFLGGEIENIEVVKHQLMAVTNGLSFAFLTTLHGLLGALFVMLPASGMQKTEEDYYIELDKRTRDMVIPVIKSRAAPAQAGMVGAPGVVTAQLVQALKENLPAMGSMKEDLTKLTEGLLKQQAESLASMNTEMLVKLNEGYTKLTSTTGKVAGDVTDQIGRKLTEINGSILSELKNSYKDLITRTIDEISRGAQSINREMVQHITDTGNRGMSSINEAAARNVAQVDGIITQLGDKLSDVGKELKEGRH